MGNAISNLFVNIQARTDKLKQGLNKAQAAVQQSAGKMSQAVDSVGAKLGGRLRGVDGRFLSAGQKIAGMIANTSKAGLVLGAGLGAAAAGAAATAASMSAIYKGTQASVEAASALNETISKTHTLLGSEVGADVEKFAKGLQRAGKVGARQAMEAVSMAATALNNQGVSLGNATDLGKALTQRAADIASQDNMSVDEVLQKIRSGLAGESEPLRSLGIYISAKEAQDSGMAFGEYAAKAILKQSMRAEGDMDRTAGSLENMKRSGQIRLEAAMESLGASFMVFHQAVQAVKNRVIAAFQAIAENPAMKRLGEALAQISLNLTNWFANTFGGTTTGAIDLFVRTLTWAFQQIARVTQLMENYTVAPLTTVKLALLKFVDVIFSVTNFFAEKLKSLTGIDLTLDRSGLQKAMDKYRADIREAGGYRGQEQVRQLQAANGAPEGGRKAALGQGDEKAKEPDKTQRYNFASLLSDVFGGGEKKYQADMLQATKEIAQNTKPKETGVQNVAQVGTLRTGGGGMATLAAATL